MHCHCCCLNLFAVTWNTIKKRFHVAKALPVLLPVLLLVSACALTPVTKHRKSLFPSALRQRRPTPTPTETSTPTPTATPTETPTPTATQLQTPRRRHLSQP